MKKIEQVGKQSYKTTKNICSETRLQGIPIGFRVCVDGTNHQAAKTCVKLAPRGKIWTPSNQPQITTGKRGGPTWNVQPKLRAVPQDIQLLSEDKETATEQGWWCLGFVILQTNKLNVPSVLELSIQEEMLGEEPRLSKMGQ